MERTAHHRQPNNARQISRRIIRRPSVDARYKNMHVTSIKTVRVTWEEDSCVNHW